jgi:hypothetical protein
MMHRKRTYASQLNSRGDPVRSGCLTGELWDAKKFAQYLFLSSLSSKHLSDITLNAVALLES